MSEETETPEEKARQSPAKARLVAADPATPGALLERLAESKDPLILVQLAQNPNTPTRTLFQLARRFPRQVLDNPAIPLLLLENPDALRSQVHAENAKSFLSLDDCPEELFFVVASHKEIMVRCEAASHPKTPASVLSSMQRDTAWGVSDALAKNPNTPREVIAKLLEYSHDSIRALAAKHPNVPTERLQFLQRAGVSFEVKPYEYGAVFRLHEPQHLSPEELESLCVGSDLCRQIAALHPDTPRDVLLALARDAAQAVQIAVATNANIDEEIIAALNIKEHYLQLALAQNPVTPQDILAGFLPKSNTSLRKMLLTHPNVSAEVVSLSLTHEEPSIRLLAAQSPKADPALLSLLRRAGASEDLSAVEATSSALSAEEIELLWEQGAFAKQLLAQHPGSSRELLSRLVALARGRDQSSLIAGGLLRNRALPPSLLLEHLHESSHANQLFLARREDTPPELLADLLESSNRELRVIAAFHFNAPTDVLRLLWRAGASPDLSTHYTPTAEITEDELMYLSQRGFFAKTLVAQHPKTPPALLEQLSRSNDYWLHAALLKNPNAHEAVLRNIPVTYGDICRQLAAHPHTPTDVLQKIVSGNYHEARANAAAHKNTAAAELERLARADSRPVRDAVARNPNTSVETLEWLALEPRAALQVALAKNPAATPALLEPLTLHLNPAIRDAARQNPSLAPAFSQLLRDAEGRSSALTSEQLASLSSLGGVGPVLAARHPNSAGPLLAELSANAPRSLTLLLAVHPNTPPEILRGYQSSLDPRLRAAVAMNPSRPEGAPEKDANPAWSRYVSAVDPLSSPEVLAALADAPEMQCREALAKHPRAPLVALEVLACDRVFVIRRAVARRPDASAALLTALAHDRNAMVKAAVARHSNTPPQVLAALATDKEPRVRRAVIQNPNTPQVIYEKLSLDASRRVRAVAVRK